MLKSMMYIYRITNPVDHSYIGKTNDFKGRMRGYAGGYGYKGQEGLERSANKYGWENHKKEILWQGLCTDNQAYRLEKFFIKKYDTFKNGLNCNSGGRGTGSGENCHNYGRKASNETRKLMSDSHKGENNAMWGRNHTEKAKQKMRGKRPCITGINHPHYGKTPSKETRQRMSDSTKGENHPFYGKHRSEETKRRIGEGNKGKKCSKEAKMKMRLAKQKLCDKTKRMGCNNYKFGIHPFTKLKMIEYLGLSHWDEYTKLKPIQLTGGIAI